MDFYSAAENMCPPAIVEKARFLNVSKGDSVSAWVEIAYSGASPECRSAIVGATAQRVTKASDFNLVNVLLGEAAFIAEANSPEVRLALKEMAQRIVPNSFICGTYYAMLWRNEIDLTVEHPPIPPSQWVIDIGAENRIAFQRAIYRLRMGVPEAQEHLAEGLAVVATETFPLQSHVQYLLLKAKLPQNRALLEPYLDDPRRPPGLFGPGLPIGEFIRKHLPR
ncbi:hypothetical protein [Litoreibacter albidus]|uniref:hypothetical protein n=1 Tax=Litoreibacter albidus TaxID=670155 RepID=UPI003736D80F